MGGEEKDSVSQGEHTTQGERPKPEDDIPAAAGVVRMLWVAGCPAASPGERAPRSHIAHKQNDENNGGGVWTELKT